MAKWTPMNKNTSPQSRSSARPRAHVRGRGDGAEHSERGYRRDRRDPAQRIKGIESDKARARRAQAPTTLRGRIRRMLIVVGVPHLVVVLGILVVAIAALLLTSSPSAWLNTIVGEAWMVFNLAPIRAGGIDLGFIPVLPALLLAWLVGRRVRAAVKDKASINDLLVLSACVLLVPLVLTFIAWLMLWDAGKVYDVSPPELYRVLPRMLLLHAAALIGGMGPRLWKALAKRSGIPRVFVDAAHIGLAYLGYLVAAGFVLVLILWGFGWSRQAEMLSSYPELNALGTISLFLVSIFYLPNAAVAAGAVLSGSEVHIGEGTSVSLFSGHLVPLPPLPLAAAVPPSISPWFAVLLVVPAIAAVVAFARRRALVSFQVALVAAVTVAVTSLVAIYGVSGTLGVYGYTGPEVWTAVGLSSLWCLVVGCAFATAQAVTAWRARRATAPVAEPEDSAVAEDVEEATEDSTSAAQEEHEQEQTALDDDTGVDTDTGTEIDIDAEAQVETDTEDEADTEAKSDTEEADSEVEADAETEAVPEADVSDAEIVETGDADVDSQSEVEDEAVADQDGDAEYTPVAEESEEPEGSIKE
ncbi:hypothetical protein J3S22_01180 [Corynebacterium aurimucosum]|uniref:cell division protein PerM n=1 Tax=Corynebacterium aurimucosum TaxID=169292 RepID=UPI00191D78C3|nr:DUF6350 family protein [Corynebacterium aurimucosum]QQU95352.1 hypothetical protein I6I66_11460 [Corynebacterium aurimucosum]UTA71743.1 hypothetical protein J3S22_01180 [Corynebacterium aurimucosum]WJY69987.1 hypothetical protein CAURIM_04285 [Corynebacterium aurimucosum]